MNESRVRIYEQIEISLSELETNNLRLSEDSAAEKSKIKSLSTTVTALENRCEELQRSLEEAEIRIRNRKEKRNSIFLQQNPNSDSLCLVQAAFSLNPPLPSLSLFRIALGQMRNPVGRIRKSFYTKAATVVTSL